MKFQINSSCGSEVIANFQGRRHPRLGLKEKLFCSPNVLIEPKIERRLNFEVKKNFLLFREGTWIKDIARLSIFAYWQYTRRDIGIGKKKGIFLPF